VVIGAKVAREADTTVYGVCDWAIASDVQSENDLGN